MPVNKRYPLEDLLQACNLYFKNCGRRISFEYALIKGVNTNPQYAKELLKLFKDFPAHINLLPVNPIRNNPYPPPEEVEMEKFISILKKGPIPVTVRKSRGQDIEAACGQLNPLEGED